METRRMPVVQSKLRESDGCHPHASAGLVYLVDRFESVCFAVELFDSLAAVD